MNDIKDFLAELKANPNKEGWYEDACRLYAKHGQNPALKKRFAQGESKWSKEKVIYKLKQLAAIPVDDKEKSPEVKTPTGGEKLPAKTASNKELGKDGGDETKVEIKDDDPIIVGLEEEKKELFQEQSNLHTSKLDPAAEVSQEDRDAAVKRITEISDVLIPGIDEKIQYFKEHGKLPEETVKENEIPTDPIELSKRRTNLRSYISKNKDNQDKAAEVKAWQEELEKVEAAINALKSESQAKS